MKTSQSCTITALILLLVGLTGCFYSNPKDIKAFLRPEQAEIAAQNYILRPPDEIVIHCSVIPELHLQQQRIRPDGRIAFENFGEIEVAGKTPRQVSKILQTKAASLYTLTGQHPIDVRVVEYNSASYYVVGQVVFPGTKDFTGRDTVLSAVANARTTVLSWTDRIQVVRPSADKKTKPRIFEVNLTDMVVKGDTSKNVLLADGDIIFVPATPLSWLAMRVEEAVRPIGRAFSTVNVVEPGR